MLYKGETNLNKDIDQLTADQLRRRKERDTSLLCVSVACIVGALILLVIIGQVKAGVI